MDTYYLCLEWVGAHDSRAEVRDSGTDPERLWDVLTGMLDVGLPDYASGISLWIRRTGECRLEHIWTESCGCKPDWSLIANRCFRSDWVVDCAIRAYAANGQ